MNRFVYLMDKYGNPYSFSLKPKYYKTLVLSGGAMRGVYLLGALNGLKIKIKQNINVYRYIIWFDNMFFIKYRVYSI